MGLFSSERRSQEKVHQRSVLLFSFGGDSCVSERKKEKFNTDTQLEHRGNEKEKREHHQM